MAIVIGLWSGSARADWAYTHWGMKLEQVVAASGGAVTALAPDKRTRDDADHWELAAEGTFTDGALKLPVGFTFDTVKGGLKCVMFNAFGDDVASLQQMMVGRYGKPVHDSTYGPTHSMTWRTPDAVELVVGQKPLAAAVMHCRE